MQTSSSDVSGCSGLLMTAITKAGFGRIQRDVIARGIFTSTTDLHKKLMRYIRQYNKNAKPLKWKYADPSRRIRCNSSVSSD
jgi:hypothetical protein